MVGTRAQDQPAGAQSSSYRLLRTEAFVAELHERLRSARNRVDIQLMTFDGDSAGLPVADLLVGAVDRGVSVRLLIDGFALRFVSDERVRRRSVRSEFRATLAMYERLRRNGVEVRFTNPNGPANVFNLARNHKKLFIIDEAVYLGGINISDHNFAWHDFMVGVCRPEIVAATRADFDQSFQGRRQMIESPIVTNSAVEATFDELVRTAERRIVVASPYAVDRRLAILLHQSKARHKTVIVARHNNFRLLELITPWVLDRLSAAGAELFSYPRFSHAKFVLADDRLLVGSSNFGRHSFWCNQEIGLVIDDPAFLETFAEAMLVDLEELEPTSGRGRRRLGWFASGVMDTYIRLYARFIVPHVPLLQAGPRALRRR